ncbi:MAG: hypothetical protein QG652_810 [Pseudomonadota bacterium]|nr:hypothetical protein [Pseudomonadota bacterium]
MKEVFVCMARMEGFEPPTAWFVARYSIQLSYMRVLWLIGKGVDYGESTCVRQCGLQDFFLQPVARAWLESAINRIGR